MEAGVAVWKSECEQAYLRVEASYSLALQMYEKGNLHNAAELVSAAMEENDVIALYLQGRRDFDHAPDSHGSMKREHAKRYLLAHGSKWFRCPSALKWLGMQWRHLFDKRMADFYRLAQDERSQLIRTMFFVEVPESDNTSFAW